MIKSDLNSCPNCGGKACFIIVDENGEYVSGCEYETGYVSCSNSSCMPKKEFYTVEAWQAMPSCELLEEERLKERLKERFKEALQRIADYDTSACGEEPYAWCAIAHIMKAIAIDAINTRGE